VDCFFLQSVLVVMDASDFQVIAPGDLLDRHSRKPGRRDGIGGEDEASSSLSNVELSNFSVIEPLVSGDDVCVLFDLKDQRSFVASDMLFHELIQSAVDGGMIEDFSTAYVIKMKISFEVDDLRELSRQIAILAATRSGETDVHMGDFHLPIRPVLDTMQFARAEEYHEAKAASDRRKIARLLLKGIDDAEMTPDQKMTEKSVFCRTTCGSMILKLCTLYDSTLESIIVPRLPMHVARMVPELLPFAMRFSVASTRLPVPHEFSLAEFLTRFVAFDCILTPPTIEEMKTKLYAKSSSSTHGMRYNATSADSVQISVSRVVSALADGYACCSTLRAAVTQVLRHFVFPSILWIVPVNDETDYRRPASDNPLSTRVRVFMYCAPKPQYVAPFHNRMMARRVTFDQMNRRSFVQDAGAANLASLANVHIEVVKAAIKNGIGVWTAGTARVSFEDVCSRTLVHVIDEKSASGACTRILHHAMDLRSTTSPLFALCPSERLVYECEPVDRRDQHDDVMPWIWDTPLVPATVGSLYGVRMRIVAKPPSFLCTPDVVV